MGVVYHSNYLVWFEMGRTEFLREAGFSYKKMEDSGFMVPVKDVQCTYLAPAHYDDLLTVETTLERMTPVRLEFTYQIKRDEQLLAKGQTTQAIVDRTGRPQNLQKKAPDLWQRLQQIFDVD